MEALKKKYPNILDIQGIHIISPHYGEKLAIPVKGKDYIEGEITGFSAEEIKQLKVQVMIKTDKWYEQPLVSVNKDGRWECYATFGSSNGHTIKAILMAKSLLQ